MKLYIPPVYQRIITSDKDILCFWGSRGGAKSESIARCIIAMCLTKKGFRAFCARQTQDNKDTTLLLIFQDIINKTKGLEPKCKIFKDKIEFVNGSIIFFVGLNKRTMDKAKGIKANIYWFDEAHELDRVTYRTLVPSVREDGSKVIISFNPRYEFDFVAKEFLKNPAPNVEVIQVDYRSNPFFSEKLERQRLADKATLPYAEYKWIWENGFQPLLENSLFDNNSLNDFLVDYEYSRENYTRIIIGIDPATTHKDYNNESGLVVVGLNKNGEAVLIKDATGHLKPSQLALEASRLYHTYNCDAVVIEVNQGGDFLKHTLLGFDSTLNVIEVRAKQDKVRRMMPIANEMYLGRIKGLREESELVVGQFMKFTSNGYLGASGESPDRAEAFAWAVFELLGISEYGRTSSVFTKAMISTSNTGFVADNDVAYAFVDFLHYGIVVFDTEDNPKPNERRILKFKKAYIGELHQFKERVQSLNPNYFFINKSQDTMLTDLDLDCECYYYDDSTKNEDLILKTIPLLAEHIDVLQCEKSLWQGREENQLLSSLTRFEMGKDADSLVKSFCYAVISEIG